MRGMLCGWVMLGRTRETASWPRAGSTGNAAVGTPAARSTPVRTWGGRGAGVTFPGAMRCGVPAVCCPGMMDLPRASSTAVNISQGNATVLLAAGL